MLTPDNHNRTPWCTVSASLDLLFNGKSLGPAVFAHGLLDATRQFGACFVDSSIGTATDEADYIVMVVDMSLTNVAGRHFPIPRLCFERNVRNADCLQGINIY